MIVFLVLYFSLQELSFCHGGRTWHGKGGLCNLNTCLLLVVNTHFWLLLYIAGCTPRLRICCSRTLRSKMIFLKPRYIHVFQLQTLRYNLFKPSSAKVNFHRNRRCTWSAVRHFMYFSLYKVIKYTQRCLALLTLASRDISQFHLIL